MLFELTVPNELKSSLAQVDNLVLVVDAETAAYPWELMSAGDKPLCIAKAPRPPVADLELPPADRCPCGNGRIRCRRSQGQPALHRNCRARQLRQRPCTNTADGQSSRSRPS